MILSNATKFIRVSLLLSNTVYSDRFLSQKPYESKRNTQISGDAKWTSLLVNVATPGAGGEKSLDPSFIVKIVRFEIIELFMKLQVFSPS